MTGQIGQSSSLQQYLGQSVASTTYWTQGLKSKGARDMVIQH